MSCTGRVACIFGLLVPLAGVREREREREKKKVFVHDSPVVRLIPPSLTVEGKKILFRHVDDNNKNGDRLQIRALLLIDWGMIKSFS